MKLLYLLVSRVAIMTIQNQEKSQSEELHQMRDRIVVESLLTFNLLWVIFELHNLKVLILVNMSQKLRGWDNSFVVSRYFEKLSVEKEPNWDLSEDYQEIMDKELRSTIIDPLHKFFSALRDLDHTIKEEHSFNRKKLILML